MQLLEISGEPHGGPQVFPGEVRQDRVPSSQHVWDVGNLGSTACDWHSQAPYHNYKTQQNNQMVNKNHNMGDLGTVSSASE